MSISGSTGKNTLEENIKLMKVDRRSNRQDPQHAPIWGMHRRPFEGRHLVLNS